MNNDQQLQEIIKLSVELNTIQDLDFLLEKILLEARIFLSSDAGSIQIKEKDELISRNEQLMQTSFVEQSRNEMEKFYESP